MVKRGPQGANTAKAETVSSETQTQGGRGRALPPRIPGSVTGTQTSSRSKSMIWVTFPKSMRTTARRTPNLLKDQLRVWPMKVAA